MGINQFRLQSALVKTPDPSERANLHNDQRWHVMTSNHSNSYLKYVTFLYADVFQRIPLQTTATVQVNNTFTKYFTINFTG